MSTQIYKSLEEADLDSDGYKDDSAYDLGISCKLCTKLCSKAKARKADHIGNSTDYKRSPKGHHGGVIGNCKANGQGIYCRCHALHKKHSGGYLLILLNAIVFALGIGAIQAVTVAAALFLLNALYQKLSSDKGKKNKSYPGNKG